MIRIIYLTCAVSSPTLCDEGVIMVHSSIPPAMCALLAQAELAARAREGWRVVRWRCEPDEQTSSFDARKR